MEPERMNAGFFNGPCKSICYAVRRALNKLSFIRQEVKKIFRDLNLSP